MAWRSVFAKGTDNHAQVVQVVCGEQHGLILTDEGVVYSWGGKDDHGQLGRKFADEAKMREPSPVQEMLRNEVVVQIACGSNHCLALTQRGALFAWGWNKAGQIGIGVTTSMVAADLDIKTPTPVKGFEGENPKLLAKSCSCGPESSACVTTKGEVYVWGAISFYLFGNGSKYKRGENCAVPVKVRGVPLEAAKQQDYIPDKISLHKDSFACTIARTAAEDSLLGLVTAMKARSSQLMAITKHRRADGREQNGEGGGEFEREELRHLEEDFKQQKLACEQRLRTIDDERAARRAELTRVSRELIVCDQQDTALTESANALEVRLVEAAAAAGGGGAVNRTLETQLNDINHFKSSNKRSKLQLLGQRDKVENELLKLNQEHAMLSQQRQQVESRAKLIRSLQNGELGNKHDSTMDDGLAIASSKREELSATELAKLCGAGRFSGFREALAISDRALQDVSSALKEVSAAIKGGDGAILEEVLEANLKLRKECNVLIQEKLLRAEKIGNQALRTDKEGADSLLV